MSFKSNHSKSYEGAVSSQCITPIVLGLSNDKPMQAIQDVQSHNLSTPTSVLENSSKNLLKWRS